MRDRSLRPIELGQPVTSLRRTGNEPLEVALVANTDHAVIVADPDGVIRFWNPAAKRIFGYSRSEALGETLDIIIPDKLRARHWDGYRRVMQSGHTDYGGRTLAVPAIRHDGTRISVEFTVTLLREPTGAICGIGAILRDVSARWRSNARCTGASASWNVSLRRFESRLEAEKPCCHSCRR